MATNDSTPKIFYIYRHIRHDKDEVFYVGKGTFTRRRQYRQAFRLKTNRFWKAIIAKCGGYDIEIMMEFDDEDAAFAKEREMIALYGRRDLGAGTLVNMTDGGEGAIGHVQNDEHKKRISQALKGKSNHWKGKTFTDEHKHKIGVSGRGKIRSEETRRRMSNAQRGHVISIGTRQKLRIANIGKRHTEEARQKISAAQRGPLHHLYGKRHTEESIEKMRQAHTGKKASDETRHKMSVAHRGKTFSAEHRRKLSERQRGPLNHNFGRHPSEETKKKRTASRRAKQQNPH